MSATGKTTFEHGGDKFTAVFGFRAMEAVEDHYDKPFFHAIQAAMPQIAPEDAADPEKIRAASLGLRISDIGKLFGFALLQHHEALTSSEVADLIDGLGLGRVGQIIGQAIAAAIVEEDEGGSTANPPKPSRKGRTG